MALGSIRLFILQLIPNNCPQNCNIFDLFHSLEVYLKSQNQGGPEMKSALKITSIKYEKRQFSKLKISNKSDLIEGTFRLTLCRPIRYSNCLFSYRTKETKVEKSSTDKIWKSSSAPPSLGDDHFGTNLIESLPQFGSLEVYSDFSVWAVIAPFGLVLLFVGVKLITPVWDGLFLTA